MKNIIYTGFLIFSSLLSNAQYNIVQKANVPSSFRHHASGFSINGKGYLGMGITSSGTNLADWWMYDPIADTWTQKSNFPGTGRSYCASFSIG